MNERPIGFRILVKPEQVPRKTPGGIEKFANEFEWEVAQRHNQIGEVIGVGDAAFALDRFGNECPLKVGDKIRFKVHAGHLFRERDDLGNAYGDFYQVINDDEVLTIIEESADG